MKICVVTGTRAEFGLLKGLIKKIQAESCFSLQVIATGTHLSHEFGLTYKEIEDENIKIDYKVEMLLSSDTSSGIVKSMGLGLIGFSDAFENLQPEAIIILGDRFELISIASAATIYKIPIIHIHGGEITEGAYDDSIRHAITKLSHIHFTSTETYSKRVIQLGEFPNFVFNVGALGVDNILNEKLFDRTEIENELSIKFKKYNFMVAYHPETLGDSNVFDQFEIFLNAIKNQPDSFFIFTKTNADSNGRIINEMIEKYVSIHPENSIMFSSLGSKRFLSILKESTAIIGNSSSGIIEAPSLKVPTINIGDRQKGRIQADSVINIKMNENEIFQAFEKVKNIDFTNQIKSVSNPYGNGDTSNKMIQILKNINFLNLKRKAFYDITKY